MRNWNVSRNLSGSRKMSGQLNFIYINFFVFDDIIRKVYSIYETNTNSRIFFSHIDFKTINVKKNLGNRIFV